MSVRRTFSSASTWSWRPLSWWTPCGRQPWRSSWRRRTRCIRGLKRGWGTLLLVPLLMVQILRTGGPDFQELLRVILTADITSGTHFSFSGTHFWLQYSSGTQFAQNYFGHDAQDLRIWSYWFQSGAMKDYDSIWENMENKYLCYIWYGVFTETWSKNSTLLQWSCPHSKHHPMHLE